MKVTFIQSPNEKTTRQVVIHKDQQQFPIPAYVHYYQEKIWLNWRGSGISMNSTPFTRPDSLERFILDMVRYLESKGHLKLC